MDATTGLPPELELPLDVPDADAAEQALDAAPHDLDDPDAPADSGSGDDRRSTPPEADEADAAEQAAVVEFDEDEYR